MVVLIPSYQPDQRLVGLVHALRRADPATPIIVIDDGSGTAYQPIFDTVAGLGAAVLTHQVNQGKGTALKTGFSYAERVHSGAPVVCADSDGQHGIDDIAAVAAAVAQNERAGRLRTMVLGARQFTGPVPSRSRFGNALTRRLFLLVTGLDLRDTQTGLRGYPAALLGWLRTVPGDRFEYELEVLLRAEGAAIAIVEVPIATVYLDENASSHFRPVVDSLRVYAPLLRFAASSIMAFVTDLVGVLILMALTGNLLVSVVGARVTSATLNFLTNRRLVFRRGGDGAVSRSAIRYAGLVVAIMAANYALLSVLTSAIGLPLVLAKVLTEVSLFLASYAAQRRFVFAGRPSTVREESSVSTAPPDPGPAAPTVPAAAWYETANT